MNLKRLEVVDAIYERFADRQWSCFSDETSLNQPRSWFGIQVAPGWDHMTWHLGKESFLEYERERVKAGLLWYLTLMLLPEACLPMESNHASHQWSLLPTAMHMVEDLPRLQFQFQFLFLYRSCLLQFALALGLDIRWSGCQAGCQWYGRAFSLARAEPLHKIKPMRKRYF